MGIHLRDMVNEQFRETWQTFAQVKEQQEARDLYLNQASQYMMHQMKLFGDRLAGLEV